MKHVLSDCISKNQSALVLGRLITVNIMVVYEILHVLKNKKDERVSPFALKLDMTKAYDKVEWPFLTSMMKKLGLNDNLVNLIMRCISSVSFFVVMSGLVTDFFRARRGIRQGDPLSPYLSLLHGRIVYFTEEATTRWRHKRTSSF